MELFDGIFCLVVHIAHVRLWHPLWIICICFNDIQPFHQFIVQLLLPLCLQAQLHIVEVCTPSEKHIPQILTDTFSPAARAATRLVIQHQHFVLNPDTLTFWSTRIQMLELQAGKESFASVCQVTLQSLCDCLHRSLVEQLLP